MVGFVKKIVAPGRKATDCCTTTTSGCSSVVASPPPHRRIRSCFDTIRAGEQPRRAPRCSPPCSAAPISPLTLPTYWWRRWVHRALSSQESAASAGSAVSSPPHDRAQTLEGSEEGSEACLFCAARAREVKAPLAMIHSGLEQLCSLCHAIPVRGRASVSLPPWTEGMDFSSLAAFVAHASHFAERRRPPPPAD